MKYFITGILFLAIMQTSIAGELMKHKIENFAVSTPEGFSIKKSSPVEDFNIYSIEKNGKTYVLIYLGNHPDFPRRARGDQEATTKLNVGDVQVISIWRDKKLLKKEMLIKLATQGWPNYIHAWTTDGLVSSDMVIAENILMSIDTQR